MRLNQVTLPSRDVERAKAFYRNLGFRLIVDAPPHYIRLEAPEGGATLSLHLSDNPSANDWPMTYFECDALDATVARLKTKGIAFDLEPVDQSWAWREARLRDPDGNPLCLYFAGANRLNPPWRVKDETP